MSARYTVMKDKYINCKQMSGNFAHEGKKKHKNESLKIGQNLKRK